jgi:hypothetical protein
MSTPNLDRQVPMLATDESLRATTTRCAEFLRTIKLPIIEQPGARGFLPGIEIVAGALLVDFDVCYPGDLLHEAGHLAVLPSRFRRAVNLDLEPTFSKISRHLSNDQIDPNGEFARQCMQCGEAEATAWAWAAGKFLGLSGEIIIRDGTYEDVPGDDSAKAIRVGLSLNRYIGVNGLQAAGWCSVRGGIFVARNKLPVFPILNRWLQH